MSKDLDESPRGPWRVVANKCSSAECPTVYTDGSRVVVQGYTVSAEQVGITVPDGEMLVEIPQDLLAEAVRNLT